MRRDIDVVMIPKVPIAGSNTDLMRKIYGGYFDEHFETVNDTKEWHVFQRGQSTNIGQSPRGHVTTLLYLGSPAGHSCR